MSRARQVLDTRARLALQDLERKLRDVEGSVIRVVKGDAIVTDSSGSSGAVATADQLNESNDNIAANTSSIATNTSNISTNTTNVSTNTTNIATNTSNIATNTSDIATNTSRIEAVNVMYAQFCEAGVGGVPIQLRSEGILLPTSGVRDWGWLSLDSWDIRAAGYAFANITGGAGNYDLDFEVYRIRSGSASLLFTVTGPSLTTPSSVDSVNGSAATFSAATHQLVAGDMLWVQLVNNAGSPGLLASIAHVGLTLKLKVT